jgi:ApeA N-terminal domain 1
MHEGWFWQPEQGDTRFYGRLENSPPDGPTLHLVDTNLLSGHDPPKFVQALFGQTLSGVPLSIHGFYPTQWGAVAAGGSNTLDGFPQMVIAGGWPATPAELTGYGFTAHLHGLRETLSGGSADGGLLNPRAGEHGEGERLQFPLDDRATLALAASETRSVSRVREHKEAFAAAHLLLQEPMTFAEMERSYLEPLCDLVAFATRRACYVQSLRLPTSREGIKTLHVVRTPYPKSDARSQRDVYSLTLNLADLPAPQETLQAWFALHQRIGPVWQLLFSTLQCTDALLENRFLNLVAFAEGYHRALHDQPPLSPEQAKAATKAALASITDSKTRRVYREALAHANSQSQAERVSELAGRCLDVLDAWELDGAAFTREVKDTRNWFNHWGKRGKDTRDDGPGLSLLVARFEVILYANLMLDLGMTDLEVATAIGSGWRLDWCA